MLPSACTKYLPQILPFDGCEVCHNLIQPLLVERRFNCLNSSCDLSCQITSMAVLRNVLACAWKQLNVIACQNSGEKNCSLLCTDLLLSYIVVHTYNQPNEFTITLLNLCVYIKPIQLTSPQDVTGLISIVNQHLVLLTTHNRLSPAVIAF